MGVFDCINSIDENVERIVSLTKNKSIQKKLKDDGIKYVISPKGNLSITSNVGFKEAKNNKVIITDSDTTFEKGCIRKMYDALNEYKITRAKLVFKVYPRNIFSKIAAEARDYVYNKPLAFTPGIGVRRDVLDEIYGFLFNDHVPWAVDADLNYRIKQANIPVAFLKDAYIYHSPLKLKRDLKAAFRIGMGVRVSVRELSKILMNPKKIKKNLKAVKKRDYFNIYKEKSLLILIYQFIWDSLYYSGYYYQKLFKKYK